MTLLLKTHLSSSLELDQMAELESVEFISGVRAELLIDVVLGSAADATSWENMESPLAS